MAEISEIIAIILAGGLGSRIRGAELFLPKPLIKVGKSNLLEHNILRLKKPGIRKITISVGYKSKEIKNYFLSGEEYGVDIDYCEDPFKLNDAGAFKYSWEKKLSDTALFVNSDEIRHGLDLEEMFSFHNKKDSVGTVALTEQQDVQNHGIFELDSLGRARKFLMNPSRDNTRSFYANCGLYFFKKEALKYFQNGKAMMKEILPGLTNSNEFYGFIFNGLYFNVGTSEILIKAREKALDLNQI